MSKGIRLKESRILLLISSFYQDSLEADENSHPEELDSGNKGDMEPEEDYYLWKIIPPVMSIDKLNFGTIANAESEWFINEDLDLAYFSAFTLDFVPSDTGTDVGSDSWLVLNALTSLPAPTSHPS